MGELHYLSIAEAGRLFRAKQLSPVELTTALQDRIYRLNPKLHAFVTVAGERALAEAKAAESKLMAGVDRSPLLGVPIAHKDIYQTKGIATTGGSALLDDWIPDEDAAVVSRWTEAGTVLLGKLITHEFALGTQEPTHRFPAARNPWDVERVPGGSSSGSGVALAAGLCLGATGSDTGGSIRGPSSWCGVSGLKPTYGRVSKYGVLPLAWSLDHAGPMARTVEDCALLFASMAGHDGRDPGSAHHPVGDYLSGLSAGVKGLRVGLLTPIEQGPLEPPVLSAYHAAAKTFEALGATVADVTVPSLELTGVNLAIMLAEAYAYHEDDLRRNHAKYGRQVQRMFAAGGLYSATELLQAQRIRTHVREQFDRVFEQVELLIMPSATTVAPTYDSTVDFSAPPRPGFSYNSAANLTGLPTITFPTGFSSEGLPVAVQVMGPAFSEALLLRAGHAFQAATDYHLRRPVLD